MFFNSIILFQKNWQRWVLYKGLQPPVQKRGNEYNMKKISKNEILAVPGLTTGTFIMLQNTLQQKIK
jgi:hypothetical protein